MKKIITVLSNISKKQNLESGLIIILITALITYGSDDKNPLLIIIIILSLVTILIPVVFTPFTAIWHQLSRSLGRVTSFIFLSLIFFLIVTPVGCIRRILKKDTLSLLSFKKSNRSVLLNRDHIYTKEDFMHTF